MFIAQRLGSTTFTFKLCRVSGRECLEMDHLALGMPMIDVSDRFRFQFQVSISGFRLQLSDKGMTV